MQNFLKKFIEESYLSVSVSKTILWFNGTYAILSSLNGRNLKLVGGYSKHATNIVQDIREMLEKWWGITNRQEAEDMITALTGEKGYHNRSLLNEYYNQDLDEYTRAELEEKIATMSAEDKAHYLVMYDAVNKYGDNAILSWDLTRSMNLLGWYYLAGYYSYAEAMNQSLEIAKRLQHTYNSWEELAEGYLNGYLYWRGDDPNDKTSATYKIRAVYNRLKKKRNSPYKLPWNLELKKSW